MEDKRLRLLSNIIIAYMLIAFAWWSILLFTKNNDAFQAKSEYLQILMVADGSVNSQEEFFKSTAYEQLASEYQRQEWMILGEAIFFVISLVIGIWLINRGYRKAIFSAQQRRNFLLSITHELKSPLASIKLALQTIHSRNLEKAQVNMLSDQGIKETDRLNDLVNNLLLAAKVETAYQPMMEDLNLPEIISETTDRLIDKFPIAEIRFENNLPNGIFSGDKFGMNAIIVNLVENAIKYSPEPAVVLVELSLAKDQINLNVSDQGYGIEPAERKRIFDRFYRIGNEDTRKAKGTGLGLYIVQQVVKTHEGKVNVLSNNPSGTKFQIFFPAKRFTLSKHLA